jgi:hypothetical protein
MLSTLSSLKAAAEINLNSSDHDPEYDPYHGDDYNTNDAPGPLIMFILDIELQNH